MTPIASSRQFASRYKSASCVRVIALTKHRYAPVGHFGKNRAIVDGTNMTKRIAFLRDNEDSGVVETAKGLWFDERFAVRSAPIRPKSTGIFHRPCRMSSRMDSIATDGFLGFASTRSWA